LYFQTPDQLETSIQENKMQTKNLILLNSIPTTTMKSRLVPFDAGGNGFLVGDEVLSALSALESELQNAENDKDKISISHFPSKMQDTLKLVDVDGDGVVTAGEVVKAVVTLLGNVQKVRFQRRVIFLIAVILLVFMCSTAGFVYGLIERSKEMTVDTDGIMNVKGSQEPVKTAIVDMRVVDGVLTNRCAGTCSNFSQSNAIQTSQVPLLALFDAAYISKLCCD
jgi:Ca2+-binding EF-hand superfamily protein